MRSALVFILCFSGTAAFAHPGHLGDLAGHDHWVAGAAIGLAILLSLREALRQRKEKAADEGEAEEDIEGEEAPA